MPIDHVGRPAKFGGQSTLRCKNRLHIGDEQ